MISVIHPSKNRPEKAKQVYEMLMSRSVYPLQYIISVDSNDDCLNHYEIEIKPTWNGMMKYARNLFDTPGFAMSLSPSERGMMS